MAEDELLLRRAAAERGIPHRTLYHAADKGTLAARKVFGRFWVTTLAAVDEWAANGPHERGRPRKLRDPAD